MALNTARPNTNTTAPRSGARRGACPAISSTGTSSSKAMGKCTASGWKLPRNCASSPRVRPSGGANTARPISARMQRSASRARDVRFDLKSGDQIRNDRSRDHPGQLLVESLELEGEFLVIDPELTQDRRVQVSHMHRVLDDVVGEIVRLSVADSGFDAAAGHPHREAARMMVPAIVVLGQGPLAVDRTAEFPTPQYQGVIQKTA